MQRTLASNPGTIPAYWPGFEAIMCSMTMYVGVGVPLRHYFELGPLPVGMVLPKITLRPVSLPSAANSMQQVLRPYKAQSV